MFDSIGVHLNFTVFFLTLLFVVLLLILLWKYMELKSKVEKRAMQMFETWRERELENMSTKKAEMMFENWRQKYEKEIRRDAIEKSRAVIAGKVTEHLIPYLPDFKYNPKNARFIGSPVDFIVFNGLDEGKLEEVVFVEVKFGKSSLTKRERQVKNIIEKRKVRWETIQVDKTKLS